MTTTKVKISPPPRKMRFVTSVPVPDDIADNLSKPSDTGHLSFVDLNFKVSQDMHRRFKLEATLRGLSMKDLLEASFKCYLEAHGGTFNRPSDALINSR